MSSHFWQEKFFAPLFVFGGKRFFSWGKLSQRKIRIAGNFVFMCIPKEIVMSFDVFLYF